MGTNGYFVFLYNGIYYAIYNHYDSYFSYLGNNLLNEIKNMVKEDKFEEWLDKFKNLIILKDISDLDNYCDSGSDCDSNCGSDCESDCEGDCISYNTKKISKENIEKLKNLAGNNDIQKYVYNIIEKCTGSYLKTLDSGIMIAEVITKNKEEIINISPCIEYIYIFDFDEGTFTVIDNQNNNSKTYLLYLPKNLED